MTGHHHAQVELSDKLQRLQAAEARHAFQLKLADRLRPLTTPTEVTAAACELLGQHLGVSRVVFYEINDVHRTFFTRSDWTAGSQASMAGMTLAMNDFGPDHVGSLLSGQVSANHDVTLDPRTAQYADAFTQLGIRATLAVPLVRSGVLTVVFALHHVVPHHWTDAEIEAVTDVAERTWAAAESARAQAELRAERDKSRHIFDTMTEGFTLIDSDWRITQMNAEGVRLSRRTPLEMIGKNLWEIWPEVIGTELETVYRRVMATRVANTLEQDINFSDGHTTSLALTAYPMLDGGLAAFFRDVTERNAAAEAVRVSQMRAENA